MRKELLFGLVLLIALFLSGNAFACSCIVPQPPLESLREASAVFSGKAVQVRSAPNESGLPEWKIQFDVSKSWKGVREITANVTTAGDSASCGYNFEEGKEYLVYAFNGEDGLLQTNLCMRTTPLESAQSDVQALGEPIFFGSQPGDYPGIPQNNPPFREGSLDNNTTLAIVVVAIVIVLGGAFYFLKTQHKT